MTQNAFNLLEQYLSEKTGYYEIRKTKECCICLEETHQRTDECAHHICSSCYYDLYNHSKKNYKILKCPMCRGKFRDTGLIDDHEFVGYLEFSKYTINAVRQKIDSTLLKSDISEKEKIKEMIELEKHTVLHYSLITELTHTKAEFLLLNPIESFVSEFTC